METCTANVPQTNHHDNQACQAAKSQIRHYTPTVDVIDSEKEFLVQMDLPGSSSDQIEIRYEDGELKIEAKVPARQSEDLKYYLREYGVGNYMRSFKLTDTIDAEQIEAEYKNGVLTLHLPKVEKAQPRKIEIKG